MRSIVLTLKIGEVKEYYRVCKIPRVRKFMIKTSKTNSIYVLDPKNDVIHYESGHHISENITPELARFIVQYFGRARNQV